MKITLKNKKVCKWASEETICFNASLVVDGKEIGTVKNDGKGGCHNYYIKPEWCEVFKAASDFCEGLAPLLIDGYTFPMNLELHLSMML